MGGPSAQPGACSAPGGASQNACGALPPQARRRKELANLRATYAYNKCEDLLDWSRHKAVPANLARLAAYVHDAILKKRGVATATPPDFFDGAVPHSELVCINPNALKADPRAYASERFVWRICKNRAPSSRPPTATPPSGLLDHYLQSCCPDYHRLCGERYDGRALLAAAGQHADLAFVVGVWPNWEGVPPTDPRRAVLLDRSGGRREAPAPTTVDPKTHQRPPGGSRHTVPAEGRDRRSRQRSLVGGRIVGMPGVSRELRLLSSAGPPLPGATLGPWAAGPTHWASTSGPSRSPTVRTCRRPLRRAPRRRCPRCRCPARRRAHSDSPENAAQNRAETPTDVGQRGPKATSSSSPPARPRR